MCVKSPEVAKSLGVLAAAEHAGKRVMMANRN
jgi:hypothetical protein